jgi:hypothetical protein
MRVLSSVLGCGVALVKRDAIAVKSGRIDKPMTCFDFLGLPIDCISSLALHINTVLGRDQAFQEVFQATGLLRALTHLLTLSSRKSSLFLFQNAEWICLFQIRICTALKQSHLPI